MMMMLTQCLIKEQVVFSGVAMKSRTDAFTQLRAFIINGKIWSTFLNTNSLVIKDTYYKS